MAQYTDFGKSIKHKLIDMDKTNTWLCDEVAKKMGSYFDDSVLSRICRGQSSKTLDAAKAAICEILDLPPEIDENRTGNKV